MELLSTPHLIALYQMELLSTTHLIGLAITFMVLLALLIREEKQSSMGTFEFVIMTIAAAIVAFCWHWLLGSVVLVSPVILIALIAKKLFA